MGRPLCDIQFLVAFVTGALPGDQLADCGTGARDRLLVGFDFRARGFFAYGADAEADFLLLGIHLDDLEVVLNAGLQMERVAVFVSGFGFVAETLDSLGDFDERAERGHTQYLAVDDIANVMTREERFPNVGLQLLDAERQTALVRLDRQHDRLYAITLLQHFRRMLHALGPAQVADVYQAVDAVFDLDERAEVSQDCARDLQPSSRPGTSRGANPTDWCQLAHAERDAAFGRVHVQNHALDLVANIDQLRGMLHALGPCHLADVDQPFDALLKFHEGSVVGHADDASLRAHLWDSGAQRRARDRA